MTLGTWGYQPTLENLPKLFLFVVELNAYSTACIPHLSRAVLGKELVLVEKKFSRIFAYLHNNLKDLCVLYRIT